ncbi:hypothetical protein WICMUC_004398 [Wickerhamomyces mucosus]|uniref:Uncharacterized protein n=1 Tax=Wickerhamomyces mucosus TaxID=1378264 RepID=A0A9P8TAD2_9ASCO|nr:hypothetical protein WICMUC_004398 [Wickerhamomyces mucosus]
MQFKSIALLGALASIAFADDDVTTSSASAASASSTLSIASGCSLSSATATAQADLNKYASCSALKGDLTISGSLATASLSGVKAIYGSLIINNATLLTSFTADSLNTITETLDLKSLTILDTLALPELATVGSINFVTLPALDSIQLNTGLTQINSIYISDTSLETLDGFDVTSLDTFNVNNNKNLNSIDSKLENVKVALEVSYNSNDVEVAFDQLQWANNITFNDVSSVSLSSLQKVNSSLGFINTSLTDIEIPNLTAIGGSLTFVSNNDLEEIELSNLTSISGGFDISNNTALSVIDGFDSLETVGGAIIFIGNFTNASLPSLKRVSGGVDIESSGDLDCDSFNSLDKKGSIQGDSYVCKGASTSVSSSIASTSTSSKASSKTSSSASGSATASSSSASSSSKGAAGSVGVQTGSILAGVAAFALSLI